MRALTKKLLFIFLAFNWMCSIAFANEEMTALQERAIESRKFSGIDKPTLLSAAINLLLDAEFVVDESDTEAGVITASKIDIDSKLLRSSDMALRSSGYSSSDHPDIDDTWSLREDYRVSLAVKPAIVEREPGKSAAVKNTNEKQYVVRVIFERQHLGRDPSFKPQPPETSKATGLLTMNSGQLLNALASKNKKGSIQVESSSKNFSSAPIVYLTETVKDPALYQRFFSMLSESVFIEAQTVQ